ncbi:hypothetical protein A28LD_0395 [Idiomarina sp. A28L]|uniref:DUF6768 family protein n=1 Tax=Idiomarina sp. A28L TaxID=1036674 RepID=UPI0002138AF7|nr:DUF6768 family protein [Idiomarina sp. A28L]EGN75907.1 hypothetical protein A28LD_0395 [Idiomarina sp. A28L]
MNVANKKIHTESKGMKGLIAYLKQGINGDLGWLLKIGYCLGVILTVIMAFCAYQFFTASPNTQVFWGVLFILTLNGQMATKLWIYMQTNHSQTMQELRSIEKRLKSLIKN